MKVFLLKKKTKQCSGVKMWTVKYILFSRLQSEKFSRNITFLDSGHVQQTAAMLANATLHTERYFGSDVKIAYRLMQTLLQHESSQQGFNLTATQDVHFTEVRKHTLWICLPCYSEYNSMRTMHHIRYRNRKIFIPSGIS